MYFQTGYHFFLVCLTMETFRSMMITASDSRMTLLLLLSGSDRCESSKNKIKTSNVSENESVSILTQKKLWVVTLSGLLDTTILYVRTSIRFTCHTECVYDNVETNMNCHEYLKSIQTTKLQTEQSIINRASTNSTEQEGWSTLKSLWAFGPGSEFQPGGWGNNFSWPPYQDWLWCHQWLQWTLAGLMRGYRVAKHLFLFPKLRMNGCIPPTILTYAVRGVQVKA